MGSSNWHTVTMAAMKKKPYAALLFIYKDATEAAVIAEEMGNPKAGQYRDEAHYAAMEMRERDKYEG
jgi:hypothetical protein